MRRRDFLQFAGATATAGFASRCAVRETTAAIAPPVPAPVAVAAATSRFRFVLKAEKFDEKTVIHDYGFGGAGMSLA